jgi:lysophospholipase L1-like esterase
MHLLLVGDSHCRNMSKFIQQLNRSVIVYTVMVPDQLDPIINQYRNELQYIVNFDPDTVLLHAGHNDMAKHSYHNPIPTVSRDAVPNLIDFALDIQANFPRAKMILSSILPRKATHRSSLNSENTDKYNKLAVRYGLRLRKAANTHHFHTSLNMFMWRRVYKYDVNNHFLDDDGLHMNESGKIQLATSWVNSIFSQ